MFLSSYVFTGPPALTVDITENARDLSVVLQWDEVDNSLPTDYTVTWTNGSTPTQSITLIEQSSYTIAGLTLDTVYNISVFAANECGQGPVYMTNISFSAGTCANTCVPLLLVLALVLYIYILFVAMIRVLWRKQTYIAVLCCTPIFNPKERHSNSIISYVVSKVIGY